MKEKQSCNVTFFVKLGEMNFTSLFKIFLLAFDVYIRLLIGCLHEELVSNSLSSATLSWQDYSASDVKQMAQRPGKFHDKAWVNDGKFEHVFSGIMFGSRISGIGTV